MTTNQSRKALEIEDYHLPDLVAVEGDAYVFVAVLEDPTLDGASNWLRQTFRVDPTAGDDDLLVDVTERYHVGGRQTHVAFEDQFTITLSVDATADRFRVSTVRHVLRCWYRHNYPRGI